MKLEHKTFTIGLIQNIFDIAYELYPDQVSWNLSTNEDYKFNIDWLCRFLIPYNRNIYDFYDNFLVDKVKIPKNWTREENKPVLIFLNSGNILALYIHPIGIQDYNRLVEYKL